MGRNSKWISSSADDATRRVACRALSRRLERVWHYLRLASEVPASETENVHQLRVFSRRATAAVETFEHWLPPKRGAWMQKQIKKVRQAAGEARDFDVIALRWGHRADDLQPGQLALLLDLIQRRRVEAQQPIDDVYTKLAEKRFQKKISRLVKRLRYQGDAQENVDRFGCLARLSLAKLVTPFLKAGAAEMSKPEALHAFRIQGKHVRYALEIFAGAFPEGLREEVYPLLVALQEQIGSINDHATAANYFTHWASECDSCAARQVLETAIERERADLQACRSDFVNWWSRERRQQLRLGFSRFIELEPAATPPAFSERQAL